MPRVQSESRPSGDRVLLAVRATAGGLCLGMVLDYFKGSRTSTTFTVGLVVFFIVSMATLLRTLPPTAPLIRLVTRTLSLLAGACGVVVIVGPAAWTGYAVAATAAFGLGGAFTPVPVVDLATNVAGVGLTGFGIGAVGWGFDLFPDDVISGVLFTLFAVGVMAYGVGVGTRAGALVAGGGICAGLMISGLGVLTLARHDLPFGLAAVSGGLGITLCIIGMTLGRQMLVGVAIILLGTGLMGMSGSRMSSANMLGGVFGFAVGAMLAVVGVGMAYGRAVIVAVGALGTGLAAVGFGASSLPSIGPLEGTALIVSGLAGCGLGLVPMYANPTLKAYLIKLVAPSAPDPPHDPGCSTS